MASRKPLTAGEIEELRELEAKATQGEWRVIEIDYEGDGCSWNVYVPAGQHQIPVLNDISNPHNAALIAAMRNALPRLLSMLTPPTDTALREAVERLSAGVNGPWEGAGTMFADIRTLLRAVQAPRLTPEQGERLRGAADTLEAHGEVLEAQWLRAAFPELAGEVGRG